MQARPAMTPISVPPSWGSRSAPPLASVTPPPPCRCPQDPPGLRIGPLIPEQDYERLEDCDPEGSQDSPLHGEEQQPLLHVPEGLRGSWHHIQNLDSFFTKISFCAWPGSSGTEGREPGVHYHQRSGFTCILLEDVFQLGQFIFIVTFTTFLLRCVDYNVLFANQPNNRTRPGLLHSKVTLSDAILPSSQCAQRIHSSSLMVFLLILATAFWLFQLLRSVCNLFSYWDIQVFYREALHIPLGELGSVSWAEVQSRLLALQRSGGLCVQPRPLTELDVHHRILRYTNYQVALANKGLLPTRCALPWGGSVAFLSRGLALNLVFFAGALFAALLVLTVYDEDVLAVEHVLTAMTALGILATVARSFIPDEQAQSRSPQLLLQAALAHMHYLPEETGPAGKASAYRQMARLLQYRAVSLTEELLSPLLTPLFLLFWFRPRALEIIDFFHHFTVDVAGVGDICSFALMDVKRHGHPQPETFLANLLVQPLLPPQDLSPTAPCPAAATASLLASISRIAQDSSCVSPGGTGGQKLAQLPELASAEMSLHAIYLYQLHQQQQQQELWGEASASSLSRPWSSPPQTLSPDEEKPSWSSDGSSPASSPRQQWRTQRAQNLFPGGFQEPTDTQKEPSQAPSID
ncbi:autophagy-related protein 9B [Camelus ferus]|nr:autophagy-related protein 9B [Camelus ferus]